VGVRADDIGAKRLEEACIPRDGGLRGGVQSHAYPRWPFKRGSYIAQIRGGTVGMCQMSARQPSHTCWSKWNTASTWGANTRTTTMRGSGEVAPAQVRKGLFSHR